MGALTGIGGTLTPYTHAAAAALGGVLAAALTVKVLSIFSLEVSNTYRFVNQPVGGFEATDTITSIALVAKFSTRRSSL
jgi:hypothetical protein